AAISVLVGAVLVMWGVKLAPRHDETFHLRAEGLPPRLADFPLLHCTYNISAEERLQMNLGNTEAHPVTVVAHDAKVVVKLYSSGAGPKLVDLYRKYRQVYVGHPTSACFDAGVLALEN